MICYLTIATTTSFTVFKKVRGNQSKPEPIQAPTPARQQPAPTSAPSTPAPAAAPPAATRQSPQSSAPAPSTPRQAAPAPSGRNVLSSDVEIKGSIKFSNDLVVDGKIEGHILSDGSLTVGENARITAEIKTRSVVIYGKVYGNIEVTHTVELKANCELVGDIKATSLSIPKKRIFKTNKNHPQVTKRLSPWGKRLKHLKRDNPLTINTFKNHHLSCRRWFFSAPNSHSQPPLEKSI